ncbi:MAG TPA: PilZ domain-containing protein [Terriglobales bacterium]|nr:PilZ domain-containing protein [Terriglobales bacterium]
MNERRKEPRTQVDLPVRVWGIDAKGALFAQEAVARNISGSGALLYGIEQSLRIHDLIGVGYGDRQARYRVVWVRDSGTDRKIQVAVHKLKSEQCPWKDLLEQKPVCMCAD